MSRIPFNQTSGVILGLHVEWTLGGAVALNVHQDRRPQHFRVSGRKQGKRLKNIQQHDEIRIVKCVSE